LVSFCGGVSWAKVYNAKVSRSAAVTDSHDFLPISFILLTFSGLGPGAILEPFRTCSAARL
jgi:hypothetical protein